MNKRNLALLLLLFGATSAHAGVLDPDCDAEKAAKATATKAVVAGSISMEDLYVLFREVKDENDKETLIHVEYGGYLSYQVVMLQAKKKIKEELKDEAEDLHKDLDKLFGF